MGSVTLADLEGLWRREFIQVDGYAVDRSAHVIWLQAGTFFCDLRQPEGLPRFGGSRCLRDLSAEQLQELAQQEGFGGVLTLGNGVAEWHRQIDYRPASGIADRACLACDGDALMEYGTERPYTERWLRERMSCAARWGARYAVATRGQAASLVRAGNYLMFARDRPVALASGTTLAECLVAVDTLEERQDLLDFEISFGTIGASGDWRIERSTLPFKAGTSWPLPALPAPPDRLKIEDLTADGRVVTRLWQRVTAN